MARQNAFGFDLSDTSLRQSLCPRFAPYWQVTEYGRAVGYQKYVSGRSYWVARMRLRDASYRQHRIAATEDNVDFGDGLSFEAACQEANLWSVLADCLPAFTTEECRHYFEAAGYDPE